MPLSPLARLVASPAPQSAGFEVGASPLAKLYGARVLDSPAAEGAIAFLHGTRSVWLAGDLADYCRRHLLARGYLTLRAPLSGRFWVEEIGAGGIELPTSPHEAPAPEPTGHTFVLAHLARERVLEVLARMVATPPDDSFLNAAIFSGRVRRGSEGHAGQRWVPSLREGQTLSCWVQTLFAADALNDREAYDRDLVVCEVCGGLGFDWATRSRTLCPAHDVARSSMRPAEHRAGSGRPSPFAVSVPPQPPTGMPFDGFDPELMGAKRPR